ncbi:MAG TPA: DUF1702 family protein [Candidatus Angelobacter sp.]|jgi:enediyne biosynthesis protein E3|nr:DUF1702 family protein [Candidatus Angelobacter sp.]
MLPIFAKLLRIDPQEVEVARRGFYCPNPAVRTRLEHIGKVFLAGYHAALVAPQASALGKQLEQVKSEYRGFAYEGAAMALTLLDAFTSGSPRLLQFMNDAGKDHIYMLHVGAGWACARVPWLRWRLSKFIANFDPLLRWLIVDGFGFHEGYFHLQTAIESATRLSEESLHVFYQGLGRSLWFVHGCDVERIAIAISQYHPVFHADAWSGVGLACGYAGGATISEIERAIVLATKHGPALAQGAVFAAKARLLAGNPAQHTDLACRMLCQLSAEDAAALCDEALSKISLTSPNPYQQWRLLLQMLLSPLQSAMRGEFHDPAISQQVASTKYN